MFVDETDLTVVGVTGAIGVVAEGEGLGKESHAVVGMLVIDRIDEIARSLTEGDC